MRKERTKIYIYITIYILSLQQIHTTKEGDLFALKLFAKHTEVLWTTKAGPEIPIASESLSNPGGQTLAHLTWKQDGSFQGGSRFPAHQRALYTDSEP